MIYLDNAATTFPKPSSVIRQTEDCIKRYCANSGRSSHRLATKTANEIYSAREAVAALISLSTPESVCFLSNATYALNTAIKGVIKSECHVIISDLEHNSVVRPLKKLYDTIGTEYSIFSTDGDIGANVERLIKNNTVAIISTLMSNVTGKEIPLKILAEIANKHKLILIADASQMIGHKAIDFSCVERGILCAPGHKALFGIQGCGFSVFKGIDSANTLVEGGSGFQSRSYSMPPNFPERMEAGTLPSPSIVSLKAGIDYLNSYTLQAVEKKIKQLTEVFEERLRDIYDVEIFACENGIISFRSKSVSTSKLSAVLDKNNVYVREGLHCAPSAHKKLGTLETGLIRISVSIFNEVKHADTLYNVLKAALS